MGGRVVRAEEGRQERAGGEEIIVFEHLCVLMFPNCDARAPLLLSTINA